MTGIQRIDLGLTDANAACGCCSTHDSPDEHATAVTIAADTMTADYLVEGMTCSHCVSSVTEELTAVDGVERVSVDLRVGATSRVTVTSMHPISVDAVRTAVEEAGYTLAAPSS